MGGNSSPGHRLVFEHRIVQAMADQEKYSSLGSPFSGKQVFALSPLPGRKPVVRGAMACAQS
eukprot:15676864-Heterocapsa_arctica.AAC.1